MKTDPEEVVKIWWQKKPRRPVEIHPDIVGERREILQQRLDELKSNNAMGVAFFYELEARLSPRRRHRFGKPFPYITDKQFSALRSAWPLYGFTDLTKHAPLVLAYGHNDYDLNREGSLNAVREKLTAMKKELGLPPRSIHKVMKRFKEESQREYVETAEDRKFTELRERIQHERLQKAQIKRAYAKLVSTGKLQEMEDGEFWQQAKAWADQKTLTIAQVRNIARRDAEELRARFATHHVRRPANKNGRLKDYAWKGLADLDEVLKLDLKQRSEALRSTYRRAKKCYEQYHKDLKAANLGGVSLGKRYF